MTVIFISVILHCKYGKTAVTKDIMLIILTISITLTVCAGLMGADSGGCFNPTVGLTETLMMLIFDNNKEKLYFRYILVYTLGPLTGGILAAIFYSFVE